MQYESPEITRERELRRAYFSARIGELLSQLSDQTPGERLQWYRDQRGEFFFSQSEIKERIRSINRAMPQHRNQVIAGADQILRHEFDILGSGLILLGDQLDWQRDFKSGICWRSDVVYPAWNWRKVEDIADAEIYRGHFYSVDDASDLKVPWDLSSFFHFPTLGEAFLQMGDQRYAKELLDELNDWHVKNPYPRGVNWTCAMVGGIRLANMTFALRLVEPESFIAEFGMLSILRHLKFILDFLEVDKDGRRNNHYLNNLVGLGFGAVEIGRSEFGTELMDFAFEELKREIFTQFSEDGTNYEGTIPYQRFATESIIVTAILLERNGRRMPSECRDRLVQILRFIDYYTKPNGLAPQIGDNDNGRILVLHDYAAQEYRDHRHILAVGAAWLGMDRLISDISGQNADVIWLLGETSTKSETVIRPPLVAGLYNSNGYALAKTNDSSLLLRCGRINPMSGGGHNHCDQLSFEFHDRGQDVIVDPGALIYSADSALRNRYRSTWAHNTLQLGDLEQQEFADRDLFAMHDRAAATVDAWEIEELRVRFRGHHLAYSAAGWKISREVLYEGGEGAIYVRDTVQLLAALPQKQEFCGRLHFASNVELEQTTPLMFLLRAGTLRWILEFGEELLVRQTLGLVSPGYGAFLPAVVLEYRFTTAVDRNLGFSLTRLKN